ncbi:MAG: hypothetical protein Q9217_003137 [Psora testacea]
MPLSLGFIPGSSIGLTDQLAPEASNNEANAADTPVLPLSEAENAVVQLYQPGVSTRDISRTQDSLHRLQRSQYGWAYANAFLQSSNEVVRFFGALTFTIKFNQDWDTLHEENASETYERVVYWFVRCIEGKDSAVVIRKLCSALVAYYLRPSVRWDRIVMRITERLAKASTDSGNEPAAEIGPILCGLNDAQLRSMLWFVETLVHELAQVDTSSLQGYRYRQELSAELDDIITLLQCAIRLPLAHGPLRVKEGLGCFQTIAVHASVIWSARCMEVDRLRAIVPAAINCLFLLETTVQATETFTEILQRFSSFLDSHHMRLLSEQLTSQDAQAMMKELKRGEYDERTMSFARLLVAFGDVAVQDIAQAPGDSAMSQMAQQLSELMLCVGCAGIEEVSGLALPFWVQYVEFLSDTECSYADEAEPDWLPFARTRVWDIVEACFHKTCWPPEAEEAVWEPGELHSFKSFRSNAQEFFQTAYVYLGVDLFVKFADIALQSQEPYMRNRLEASIFALNGLSESFAAKELNVDGALSRLFTSGIIFGYANNAQGSLSIKLKRTTVTMITNYTSFFENHPRFLAPMLNFLFDALQNPKLVNVASIAIKSVCSSCRTHLVPELGAFLEQYTMLLAWDSVDADIRERVIGGVASIIQALPSDEAKYYPLATLIQLTQDEFAMALHYLEANEVAASRLSAVRALRLLVSIGKALRVPENVANPTNGSTYWSHGDGATLQTIIYQMVTQAANLMRSSSEVMEAICQILRAGYNEIVPGPFTFPLNVTVEVVLGSTLETARLEYVFETAGAMLAKKSDASQNDLQNAAFSILSHAKDLLCLVDDIRSQDPDLIASIIELMEKMIPHYMLSIMMLGPQINSLFAISLAALAGEEASFVQRHEYEGQVAAGVAMALNVYGPQLCHVLAFQIGGDCARSQLDTVAEPLRKLIPAQPQARRWLTQALGHPDFPSSRIGVDQKRIWMQKIYQ